MQPKCARRDIITEARTGRELELLRKPSPLGDERGEFEGGWAVEPDAGNSAFPRAIPHGTVIIDVLFKVVIFGVSPGCLRAASRAGSRSPSGDRFSGEYDSCGS